MVPGLEEHIMSSGSDEDLLHIADMVCLFFGFPGNEVGYLSCRSRRGHLLPAPTTPKVWRDQFSTGLPPKVAFLPPPLCTIINQGEGSITQSQAFYCALLNTTGQMKSMFRVQSLPDSISIQSLLFFRVKSQLRTTELFTSGDQWTIFLYKGNVTNPEKPWDGLFQNTLLVMVRIGN